VSLLTELCNKDKLSVKKAKQKKHQTYIDPFFAHSASIMIWRILIFYGSEWSSKVFSYITRVNKDSFFPFPED
jgi:hypothetical protein